MAEARKWHSRDENAGRWYREGMGRGVQPAREGRLEWGFLPAT